MVLSVQVSWERKKAWPAGWVEVVVRRWVRKRRVYVCDVSLSVGISWGWSLVFGKCLRRAISRTSRPGFEGG